MTQKILIELTDDDFRTMLKDYLVSHSVVHHTSKLHDIDISLYQPSKTGEEDTNCMRVEFQELIFREEKGT